MNIAQKKIIGWALVLIGLAMVVGVVINTWSVWGDFNALGDLLVSPLFYVGLIIGIAGVVVLKGEKK